MILGYPCRFYSVIVGLRAPKKIAMASIAAGTFEVERETGTKAADELGLSPSTMTSTTSTR